MQVRRLSLLVMMGIVAGAGTSAKGLINPKFTPIHLCGQAEIILKVAIKPGDKPSTVKLEVLGPFKPKADAPKGPITIDLSAAPHKAQSELVDKIIADRPGELGLLFVGEFKEEGEGPSVELPEAFLHFAGRWLDLFKGKDGSFEMDKISTHMEGTWAGSTDMFVRAVDYVLTDQAPNVPVTGEASWDFHKQAGKLDGKVHALIPVDLDDGLAQCLFVAAEKGDRLFQFDKKEQNLADLTGQRKLTSKSVQAVWGDFNRDGKLDLASWDGKSLSLHLQQGDGTFQARPLEADDALNSAMKDGCASLSLIDSGKEGRAGLLVGTSAGAVMVAPAGDGKWASRALGGVAAATQPASLGKGGQCLAADFDGDAVPDILQLFANGGLFYKGKDAGQFDKPVPCQVALGDGQTRAWTGDYDGDGLIDVFVVAEDAPRLWHNLGQAKFINNLGLSGELAYISKPGGVDGGTGDFNNDGRQDIMIAYSGMAPQLFFNRGYRSFGHAHQPLDVDELGILPEAVGGQQAGCLGDFNGDGGQDMAIVLKTGELWVFYRKVFDDSPALYVRVSLASNGPSAGPATVVGYSEKRCLGAWSVTAGSQSAVIALREAGPCLVKWQLPGGKPQQKEIVLVDKPVRFVIPADK